MRKYYISFVFGPHCSLFIAAKRVIPLTVSRAEKNRIMIHYCSILTDGNMKPCWRRTERNDFSEGKRQGV